MRALAAGGWALLVWGALTHAACAQSWQDLLAGPWSAPQTPHPAVARISVPQRDNSIAFGSGTLIDTSGQLGLVITNWHVVDGAAGEILVTFPDGFRSGGRVLKVDRDWDLAAVAIQKPKVQSVPLASQPPRPGDMLTIAGYGQGRYRAASGKCTQYVAPGLNFPYEMIEVAAAARQGDSGGPIFNTSGQLAGVLFGEGGGRTSGSHCRRVHQFLSTISIPPGGLGPVPPPGTSPAFGAVAAAGLPVGSAPGASGDLAWQPGATGSVPAAAPPLASHVFASTTTSNALGTPSADSIAPLAPLRPVEMARESSLTLPPENVIAEQPPGGPTNRFRPPAASAVVETTTEPAIDWREWAGSEPLEQIKSVLAVVGAMALAMHAFRWFRTG